MFAQYVSLDASGVDSDFLGEQAPQSDAVQKRPAADDLSSGQAGALLREVGQDIDGVGDQEHHAVLAERLHVADGGAEDCDVA